MHLQLNNFRVVKFLKNISIEINNFEKNYIKINKIFKSTFKFKENGERVFC